MFKYTYIALALLTTALAPFQGAQATSASSIPSPSTAEVAPAQTSARAFFVNLKNNQEITSPFTVKFGIEGMKIAPAPQSKPGTGHFHLLIDTELTEAQQKMPIPTDSQHLHFGGGQSEVNLTLPRGKHTLRIVMGDGGHKLHTPPVMSEVITVNVK